MRVLLTVCLFSLLGLSACDSSDSPNNTPKENVETSENPVKSTIKTSEVRKPNMVNSDVKLCAKLNDDKFYENNESYKKLLLGKDGWIFRTKTDFFYNLRSDPTTVGRIARLNKAYEHQGIKLVISLIPTRGMLHDEYINYPEFEKGRAVKAYQDLAKALKAQGITIGEIESFSAGQKFYYKRDHHWDSNGAKMMAQNIAKKIKALPVYSSLEKKEYYTQAEGTYDQYGTFSKYTDKICGGETPPERVPDYKTFLKDSGGEDDLFGDDIKPEIVLVGTSNSTQSAARANFDGFLREYIGADVENLAVSGGGIDTAMLAWLASDEYKVHKPKIVIWELPVYVNYRHPRVYNQITPSVYGKCKGEDVILTKEVVINGDELALFSAKNDGQNIIPQGHYLTIDFDSYKAKKIYIEVKDNAGTSEKFRFKRSKTYKGENTFFYELNQDNKNPIDMMRLYSLPGDANGKVTMQVCSYPKTKN